jgi:hypothetical protein
MSRVFLFVMAAGPSLSAIEPLPPRLYDVTIETSLPHLEENLRYSITHEKRCLAEKDFSTAFPVLAHPALASCRLDLDGRTSGHISYILSCAGGHGTTGHAEWDLGKHQITGTLYVKLGGKNMTFQQRLTAEAVAAHACVKTLRGD